MDKKKADLDKEQIVVLKYQKENTNIEKNKGFSKYLALNDFNHP